MQDDALTPEDAEFYRAALHEIIGLAGDLARRIHAAAAAPEPTLSLEQASIALDRTARTLRRTVLLARRIHRTSTDRRTAARRQLIRGVEDAIHRATRGTPDHGQALAAEFEDRLDRPDLEADLATRPIPELIEELARDLGVATQGRSFVFPRRTPAAIETLSARAHRPSKPPPGTADAGAGQAYAKGQSGGQCGGQGRGQGRGQGGGRPAPSAPAPGPGIPG